MDEIKPNSEQLSPVKQALAKLREMSARIDELESRRHEPIAIVGAGLRFPGGCRDLAGFWRLLAEGIDAMREVPPERWDIEAYFDPDPDAPGKMYARHGGFLDNIDQFDPAFFGISPREAESLDPQQRLLLEVGWEALENAGLSPQHLSESASAIYLAINNSDYFRYLFNDPEQIDAYATTGNAASIAASRLAYLLNLKGPALAVDTACSSALVAVHLAVQSLRLGECDLALAGGVNLMLLPELTINFCKSRMLSKDGRCRTFDAEADGYARGEGCAMIALKRVSDAKRDGDPILALIRGSAINQDGRSSGVTAPNGPAQEAVIRRALADGQVEASAVGYIEAHGTATPLGDPIEAQALGAVFRRDSGHRLIMGSVKTNIGHLEGVAGLAGLIKAALALQKGIVPPSLHFKKANPHIALDEWGLSVPTAAIPWLAGPGARIAGVSSFGLSGTNAHVVLEQYIPPQSTSDIKDQDPILRILTVSGRDAAALQEASALYEAALSASRDSFADICRTAATGRAHFSHRLAVLARSSAEASGHLAVWRRSEAHAAVLEGRVDEAGLPGVVFLFTGQGSQYEGMGRALYDTEPVFRDALLECDRLLRPHLDVPLLELLYPAAATQGRLDQTRYTQPALFALEYALVRLWRSWGIQPAAVMGHSLGEYAAACAADVFSLADGLELVARRAALISALPEAGAMAVLFAEPATVADLLASRRDVGLAALNGPANTVISGATDGVRVVVASAAERGITAKMLHVSHAFHSALMEPMLDDLEKAVARITVSEPRIVLISNLTGQAAGSEAIGRPQYWRHHLREPVRFAESMKGLVEQGYRIFVEIGPQPVLSGMAKSFIEEPDIVWLPSLRRGGDDRAEMLAGLAALHVRGAAVAWDAVNAGAARRRVALPTYPFQRARYWAERTRSSAPQSAPDSASAWEFVARSARRQAGHVPQSLRLESYPERWRLLDELTRAFIAHALLKLGLFTQDGETRSVEEILAARLIVPTYHKLMERWLELLSRQGDLRQEGSRFIAAKALDDHRLESCLDQCAKLFSDQLIFFDYLQRCGRLAAEIVAGRQDPLETLFPGGSSELAEWLYADWEVSRYISAIAAASASAAAVNARAAGAVPRFIEVGAGTGGTTGSVLNALPPGAGEYWFTDVSEFFFNRARQRFNAHPLLRFGLLDVEKEPAGQGFAPGSFHAVIATNVLHATLKLDAALENVRALLAPGGVLILSEVTEAFSWYDITTGLIEGWQRFEDEHRRQSPLMAAEQWQALLRAKGFEEVTGYPSNDMPSRILGQHVILARAPLGKRPLAGTAVKPDQTLAPAAVAADSIAATRLPEAAPVEGLETIGVAPPQERMEKLVELVRRQLAAVLRLDARRLPEPKARLMDLGLDSLMAVELRNRLTQALGLSRKLPATLVFDYPTAEAIARFLDKEYFAPQKGPEAQPPAAAPQAQGAAAKIAELSDAEVERMLMERLKRK